MARLWAVIDGFIPDISASAAPSQEALLKSLADAQLLLGAILQRNQELLQAQNGEIKQLSATIAQMATRLDGLNERNAQASIPLAPPKRPATQKVVAPKPGATGPVSLAPERNSLIQATLRFRLGVSCLCGCSERLEQITRIVERRETPTTCFCMAQSAQIRPILATSKRSAGPFIRAGFPRCPRAHWEARLFSITSCRRGRAVRASL